MEHVKIVLDQLILYIFITETNVSVYLKRGVFDDEIADDMEWRRSGHQPVAGHIGENKRKFSCTIIHIL